VKLERIQEIYSELEKFVVQLHPDPRSLGPLYLNDLIATTRNHLNAVSRIQLEVHQEKQYLAREIRAHETLLQISSDELLANDERVRRLPSIEDRKATVAVFLRSERQTIENFKALLQDVEFVEKAVKHRHKELTSTMSEIKLQRSLIRDEIDTGAMYGDERTQSSKGRPYVHPLGEDFSDEELQKLLEGNLSTPKIDSPKQVQAQEAVQPVSPPPPEPEVLTDDQKIASFLGDLPSDEDFSKILAEI